MSETALRIHARLGSLKLLAGVVFAPLPVDLAVVPSQANDKRSEVKATGQFIIVTAIEAGKLYGWEDRWAVRIRYRGQNDKPETLLVSFGHATLQSEFVQLLQKMGFLVDNAVLTTRA